MQTRDKKGNQSMSQSVGITTGPPNVIGWRSLREARLLATVISRTVITGGRLPHSIDAAEEAIKQRKGD